MSAYATHLAAGALDPARRTLRATRDGYGQGLVEAGERDPRVVALCADVTESTRTQGFAERFPHRFFELGVSEQNLVGVAAGMAQAGLVPFAASYAVFSPGRSWDQLRVSVCYSNGNVKLVGGHAGVTVGPDGATHQALEDLAITRVLPNLVVLCPTDAEEARKATLVAARWRGPVYLRLGREPLPQVTTAASSFAIGRATCLRTGTDATVVACGAMVYESLLAAEQLAGEGIEVAVLASPSIKPLDADAITEAARRTRCVVTAEEHQVAGGLGGAVAELLAERRPVPVVRVGVQDVFGESGPAGDLLTRYGLRAANVIQAVRRALDLRDHSHP